MRRYILLLAFGVSATACPPTAPSSNSDGALDIDSSVPNLPPPAKGGARLRAVVMEVPGSRPLLSHFFDTQRNEKCHFAEIDGTGLRCLPNFAEGHFYYTDPNCTQFVVGVEQWQVAGLQSCTSNYVFAEQPMPLGGCSQQVPEVGVLSGQLMRVTTQVAAPTKVYQLGPSGCVETSQWGPEVHFMATPVSLEQFASATVSTVPVNARFSYRILTTADGAQAALAPLDAQTGKACYPIENPDGQWRCLPMPLGSADTRSLGAMDSACSKREPIVFAGSCSLNLEYVALAQLTPCVPPRILRATPAQPLYDNQLGPCEVLGERPTQFTGTEVDYNRFQSGVVATVGAGDVRLRVWRTAAGLNYPLWFADASGGEAVARRASDGKLRLYSDETLLNLAYRDPACTQPLASASLCQKEVKAGMRASISDIVGCEIVTRSYTLGTRVSLEKAYYRHPRVGNECLEFSGADRPFFEIGDELPANTAPEVREVRL